MSSHDRAQLDAVLESLIDQYDLARIIESLARVCFEKGEHIRSNWQDEPLAEAWESDGQTLLDISWKVA